MKRNQEREQAFALIFEKTFRDDSLEDIIEDAICAEFYEESDFSEKVFRGVFDNLEEIDSLISSNLKGWKIDRISKVSLCILRLAVYEIKYVEDIPVSVSINEAIELAKKYASSEDVAFVNGILGSISRA